ncbi:glycosyltransferase [Rhizobium sp. RHZ01]|uniref:glycosyltransferase n=1 Tax=Rhizobium sp. RHZ01 TaxID=2769304 RepID=UPI00177C8869|nr:glycosyltransferase [Rhizobium sp. RHZ01]MBD9443982.1 glycosyltransferase [Rhizobium sp. RHZ01]
MNELVSMYRAHKGKVTDRWASYLSHYERLLLPYRERPIRLLEIGIQNGGSLEIWGKYFPHASLLVGCDINPLCKGLAYDDPRIAVVVADASTDRAQQEIEARSTSYDIIIEDGSHRSDHIVDAFARYFPLVADGGIFITEDLHCSYWQEFEGGLANPYSSIGFFKRVADLVNHEHWGVAVDRSAYLAAFATQYGSRFDPTSLSHVHSVEFINSMCVIRKRVEAENQLGPRLIVGEIEEVSNGAKLYNGTRSLALDQTNNIWSNSAAVDLSNHANLSERLIELEGHLAAQSSKVSTLEQHISDLAEDALEQLNTVVQGRDAQLAALIAAQSSPAVRLARLMERAAARLFPLSSIRRRMLRSSLRLAERIYRYGLFRAVVPSRGALENDEPTAGAVVGSNAAAHPAEYAQWIRLNEPSANSLEKQRSASPEYNALAPLFSIILPVYKIPSGVLAATITSLQRQTWQNWEACIAYADLANEGNWELLQRLAAVDSRIKIHKLAENGGISRNSNAALEMACGEYVALLDHDDELTPWALHDMASRIKLRPDADFLYSDKDSINASGTIRRNPLFKPQWSPEMLYSVNYLTHLNVMRRTLVQEVGGWQPETDGAQDWDLFLRVTEKSRRIEHVSGIHYHWRTIAGSTSTGIGAKPYAALGQLRAIETRIQRLGLPASVLPSPESGFRLVWQFGTHPCVDLVLHGGKSPLAAVEILNAVLEEADGLLASVSLIASSDFDLSIIPDWLPGGIQVHKIVADGETALTEAVDQAARAGEAPVVMLLDAKVKRLGRHSLRELVGWTLLHPEIAFASALVMLQDDTVIEAGRVAGDDLRTQPLFRGMPLRHWGPLGGPLWYRNVSSVASTAVAFKRDACLFSNYIGRSLADAVAGCCAGAVSSTRRGLVTPYARVYLDSLPDEVTCDWHESFRSDPFFHPAFGSVQPLTLA